MYGIADDVDEDLADLLFVGLDDDAFFGSEIADGHALRVVGGECHGSREFLRDIDFVHLHLGLFGESGERSGDAGEVIDLLNKHGRSFVELGIELLGAFESLQLLDGQFHGREGIVDLMGNLPCHGAPRGFAFGLRQFARRLCECVQHLVILGDEESDLVGIGIRYMCVRVAQGEAGHLSGNGLNRCCECTRKADGEDESRYESDDEQRQESCQEIVQFLRRFFLRDKGRHSDISEREEATVDEVGISREVAHIAYGRVTSGGGRSA